MAVWGIAFGVAATLTGAYALSAIEGGFLAEGFFLVVILWVVFLVMVAKLVNWMKRK